MWYRILASVFVIVIAVTLWGCWLFVNLPPQHVPVQKQNDTKTQSKTQDEQAFKNLKL